MIVVFVGTSLQGGILAWMSLNNSKAGGIVIDVTFAPNVHLKRGKLQGKIQRDKDAPELLENVRILKGSELSYHFAFMDQVLSQEKEVMDVIISGHFIMN